MRAPPRIPGFEERVETAVEPVREELDRLVRLDAPVLAGPFTGEVGFELLYWVPLLRWAVTEFPELRDRLVVISRGGTGDWTADISARYADVYEFFSPAEVAARRPSLKQRVETEFERELQARVEDELQLGEAGVLHPEVLFNLYYRARKIDSRIFPRCFRRHGEYAEGLCARYAPLPRPPTGRLAEQLPERYAAVRFYTRPSFPDTEEIRAFVAASIQRMSRELPVVLLNNGLELDDHGDLPPAADEAVIRIDHLMQPQDNLAVQSAALAGARLFAGTYGGLAYLAPLLGVPSLAFTAVPDDIRPWHQELAELVFRGPGFGRLVTLHPDDLELTEVITGVPARW